MNSVPNRYALLALIFLALVGMFLGAKRIFFGAHPAEPSAEAEFPPDETESDFRSEESTGDGRLNQIKMLVDKSIRSSSHQKIDEYIEEATE